MNNDSRIDSSGLFKTLNEAITYLFPETDSNLPEYYKCIDNVDIKCFELQEKDILFEFLKFMKYGNCSDKTNFAWFCKEYGKLIKTTNIKGKEITWEQQQ